jgi:hypothetical protein
MGKTNVSFTYIVFNPLIMKLTETKEDPQKNKKNFGFSELAN